MYRELERAIGELRVNHTDKEITRVFCQHSSIVKRVSYEYTDNVTVAELRADHPELSFMDDDEIEEILEQAKVMRGTKEPDEDERLTLGDMKKLLVRNEGWGLAGSEQQYSWIQTAAKRGMIIEELAGMVWVCTEHGSIDDIESTMREYLKEKREKEQAARAVRREELSQKIREELERRRHVEDIALDRIARNDHAGAIEILEGLDDSIIEGLHREYMDLLKDEGGDDGTDIPKENEADGKGG